ncbi:MAG: head GIN domain-containing protein [Saprospiraceae bacterium]
MKNLFLTLALLLTASFTFAQSWWGGGTRGEGAIVERTIDLDRFDGFALTISGNVYVEKGSTQKVVVKGQENLIDLLNTDVNDGFWKIKFTESVSNMKKFDVYITVANLEEVYVSGSGDVYSKGTFSGNNMEVGVSGSGNIEMDVDAGALDVKVSGSGNIELAGNARAVEMRISGSGDIDAGRLKAKNCEAKVTGSGDIRIHASEELNASIVGSGDIYYDGDPKVRSRVTGSGDVRSN